MDKRLKGILYKLLKKNKKEEEEIIKIRDFINGKDNLKVINNDNFDILTFTIENAKTETETVLDLILLIINHPYYSNLNYTCIINGMSKTPLFIAVVNNKLRIANLLLKYGARMNYIDCNGLNIFKYIELYYIKKINIKEIYDFIFDNYYDIKENIILDLIEKLIINNKNKLLKILMQRFQKVNNSYYYILQLLFCYTHKTKISNNEINKILCCGKFKYCINESLYQKLLCTFKNNSPNYKALNIIIRYDNRKQTEILNLLHKYNLYKIIIYDSHYNFGMEKELHLLEYLLESNKYYNNLSIFENILENICRSKKIFILHIIMKTINNSKYLIQQINFNRILNLYCRNKQFKFIEYILEDLFSISEKFSELEFNKIISNLKLQELILNILSKISEEEKKNKLKNDFINIIKLLMINNMHIQNVSFGNLLIDLYGIHQIDILKTILNLIKNNYSSRIVDSIDFQNLLMKFVVDEKYGNDLVKLSMSIILHESTITLWKTKKIDFNDIMINIINNNKKSSINIINSICDRIAKCNTDKTEIINLNYISKFISQDDIKFFKIINRVFIKNSVNQNIASGSTDNTETSILSTSTSNIKGSISSTSVTNIKRSVSSTNTNDISGITTIPSSTISSDVTPKTINNVNKNPNTCLNNTDSTNTTNYIKIDSYNIIDKPKTNTGKINSNNSNTNISYYIKDIFSYLNFITVFNDNNVNSKEYLNKLFNKYIVNQDYNNLQYLINSENFKFIEINNCFYSGEYPLITSYNKCIEASKHYYGFVDNANNQSQPEIKIFLLLLENGANLNLKNKSNRTVLEQSLVDNYHLINKLIFNYLIKRKIEDTYKYQSLVNSEEKTEYYPKPKKSYIHHSYYTNKNEIDYKRDLRYKHYKLNNNHKRGRDDEIDDNKNRNKRRKSDYHREKKNTLQSVDCKFDSKIHSYLFNDHFDITSEINEFNVNMTDNYNNTILYYALLKEDMDAINYLISLNSNPIYLNSVFEGNIINGMVYFNLKNMFSSIMRHHYLIKKYLKDKDNNSKILKLIIQSTTLSLRDKTKMLVELNHILDFNRNTLSENPLITAMTVPQIEEAKELVSFLLSRRIYIKLYDYMEETLIFSLSKKLIDFIPLFTKFKKYFKNKSLLQKTIITSIDTENEEMLRLLLDIYYGNINYFKNENAFPLLKAIDKKNLNMVKLLVDQGCDLKENVFYRKESVLYYAITRRDTNSEIIKYLIGKKASMNIVSEKQFSKFFSRLEFTGNLSILKYLVHHEESHFVNNLLKYAIKLNRKDILNILIDNKLNIETKIVDDETSKSYTLWKYASKLKNVKLSSSLLNMRKNLVKRNRIIMRYCRRHHKNYKIYKKENGY